MKLLNIGFGNMVNADRIIGIVSPDSAPIKRLVQDAREKGALIDASYGRRTQAVLTDGGDDVASQPFLKRKGDRLVRTAKKEIEPLLGNDEHFLHSSGGVYRLHTLPFLRNSLQGA